MKTLHQELAEEFAIRPRARPNGWHLEDFMEFKYRQNYTLGDKFYAPDGEVIVIDVLFVKGEAMYKISYCGLVEDQLLTDDELRGLINND